MTGPLAFAALLSLPAIYVLVFRPVQRRLALRYPARRPVEAALVILGTLLGTSIITGSLIVGDTIDRSISASAYDQLGPIDELITVSGLDEGDALARRFDGFDAPGVDGVLSFVSLPVAVSGEATQPRAQLLEIDFDQASSFGGDPTLTGISGPTPAPGRAVVTEDLARRAGVEVGDAVSVYAYGQVLTLDVDRVAPRTGVAGFWPIDGRQQSYNVLVAPGTVADLLAAAGPGAAGSEPPSVQIAVSNDGGVEDGADATDAVVAEIDAVLAGTDAVVRPVKRDLLDAATEAASGLTQLYFTMGMFAVAAGVLLVVNIFVMLADERRSELGMLRAIGLRRLPLVGAFTTEGWLYALSAGAIGAVLGIGFGWVIAWRASQILEANTDQNSLSLTFSFEWSTVVTGFAIGFAISLVTIVATSVRTSRANVIAAIRDLPAQTVRTVGRRWEWVGAWTVLLGVAWTVLAAQSEDVYGVAIGPMLVMVGLGPWVARGTGVRAATAIVSVALLVWGTAFIPVVSAMDIEISIPVFLVQGLSMAAAGVALIATYQGVIGRWLAARAPGSLSLRLGMAYPIARRWRTAMTLGMFAIVILTLVYLSMISYMFTTQVDDIAEDMSGGFGVVVVSNPTNPVTSAELSTLPGVGEIAPLAYGFGEFEAGGQPPRQWPVTGFGPELVASPPVLEDRGPYPSDDAAWNAVLADPGLIIVDDFFLASGGGPPTGTPDPGDTFVLRDPVSGNSRTVEVAALAQEDLLFNGAFYGMGGLDELTEGRAVASRFYVEPTTDGTELAGAIRTEFLANGADAEAVVDTIDAALAQQTGFFTLMQQFVGVGLLVGVAGIGVIMVRAVRERRRVVGVLRSLGFQPGAVGSAFLIEAAFVAFEGVVLGVLVALVGSYGLVLSGASFAEGMQWGVPWRDVLGIAALALVSSAVAAVWPARRAARIAPAEALRVSDGAALGPRTAVGSHRLVVPDEIACAAGDRRPTLVPRGRSKGPSGGLRKPRRCRHGVASMTGMAPTPLRVAITGGSGFIGAHSARALAEAGHSVRFLVRSAERLERSAGALGVPTGDLVVGDVTDAAAVRRALDGCDAVLHAAAIIDTGADADGVMAATNAGGARTVLGTAVEMGLDPVVHVSSGSVLYPTDASVVDPDSPIVDGLGPYAASKVAAERFARQLQARGAPVVCTYPMAVLGPPAGDRGAEAATALPGFLRVRVVTDVGHWSALDVRDLADVHAAAMVPGLGPRRYTCGGHFFTTGEAVRLMELATGHSIRRIPVPASVMVAMGGLVERVSRVVHATTPFTRDAMVYLTRAVPVDDSRTIDELGVTFRDPLETMRATIRGLAETGAITREQAGRAVD